MRELVDLVLALPPLVLIVAPEGFVFVAVPTLRAVRISQGSRRWQKRQSDFVFKQSINLKSYGMVKLRGDGSTLPNGEYAN